jgi:2-polyprenyl-6-methoxyphenol hydroxylase-like FAD-dependent oxidoreductase
MGGLLAARILSDYFDQVTILERDAVHDGPESRKGQPQTRHLHALLAKGLEVMTRYFPDLPQGLVENGAIVADMGETMRWYTFGGYRVQAKTGFEGALMSRPLLEWQVRRRVLALPNVTLLDAVDVERLAFADVGRRVEGVQVRLRQAGGEYKLLWADLTVDAGGRGTAAPKWLDAAGYGKPQESIVKVNMGYATRIYRRRPGDLSGAQLLIVAGEAPHDKRAGLLFPIEGDRWICTLAGQAGDYPPTDEAGFLAYVRSLAAPDVYNLVSKLEPLSEIVSHRLPSSLRRHYEKMPRFPEGYLVLGDAVCSFNPVYGQGMTSATLQADALGDLLHARAAQGKTLAGLAPAYFKRVAKIVDIPWQMAVGEDFRYAETEGKKARGTDFVNAYGARLHRATHSDPQVLVEFLKVMNLMQPPASLFHPKTVWRVLRSGRRQESTPQLAPAVAGG